MSKRAALVAWLWQLMLARGVPSLYMAQLGDMLAGPTPQHDSCGVCGSGPGGKVPLASAGVDQTFVGCDGTNMLDGWSCACYVDAVLEKSACSGRSFHTSSATPIPSQLLLVTLQRWGLLGLAPGLSDLGFHRCFQCILGCRLVPCCANWAKRAGRRTPTSWFSESHICGVALPKLWQGLYLLCTWLSCGPGKLFLYLRKKRCIHGPLYWFTTVIFTQLC